jgi:Asp/Glu/hydantoin racemase
MKLLYVVVDDVDASAEQIEEYAERGRRACPEGDTFDVVPIAFGPTEFYESAVGAILCAPALLDVVQSRSSQYDAVLIGCFTDPALRAAREVSRAPVIGGGESALLVSQLVSRRFGVVTIEDSVIPEIAECVESLGLDHRCVGINALQMPYYALFADHDATLKKLESRAQELVAAGAESIVLGCMTFGFYPFAEQLGALLGVPVVDGLRSAIAAAHVLDHLDITHSRRWVPRLENSQAMIDFLGNLKASGVHQGS